MATRRPQRTRRRTAPATSLPRPTATEPTGAPVNVGRGAVRASRHRAHHVTTDYHYVRKDLLSIVVLGGVCAGFIVGMALYIGAI